MKKLAHKIITSTSIPSIVKTLRIASLQLAIDKIRKQKEKSKNN